MAEIAGLQLVVPSSVSGTGVSLSGTGKITLSSATSWSVNGCFTSSYDNYVLTYLGTASPAHAPSMYLRSGGTDNTSSAYLWQEFAMSGTSITGGRGGGTYTFMYFSYTTTTLVGLHNYIFGPNLSQPTCGRVMHVQNTSSTNVYDLGWTHNVTASYDGFSVVSSGGASLSGTVCVYGMNK